ncbi:MAG TPA: ATP-dependent protease ATPase subunit HslU [Ktedonobacterales bacterium]|nr:ATP-dependent protease ATPase subunit HslU [Ktedonobacterales bacterium]
MRDLTPQQIVRELDRYIVGQPEAKRVVAIALRNRYRRLALPAELQAEITPKNILMIGPTGVGKTEIARRLAKMADAPFVKVEATKFTQVGYVGRDVESIIRDLMDAAIGMVHEERVGLVREKAAKTAENRIIDILVTSALAGELESQQAESPAAKASGANGAKASRASGSAKIEAKPETKAEANGTNGAAAALPAGTKALQRRAYASATKRQRKQAQKQVAERMARKELEEQIIEIELDPDDTFSSVFEFVAGLPVEDIGEGFPDLLGGLPGSRRRSRQVSVREARRLLTQEEANKLIDYEQVVEQATQRVEQAGVVFLDEIDKVVGSKVDIGPDVAGEGVQRDLLPIIEGSSVMTRFGPIKTDHILWIAAGAFHSAKPADLIPELQGRLPLRVELASLGEDDFRRILQQPENALTKQYQALLGVEQVTLEFTDDGISEIARCAHEMNERVENIGARRLHTIMEKVLEDVSFDAPELAGQNVTVNAAFVQGRLEKLLGDDDLSRYIL